MLLSAAQALLPQLQVLQQQCERERQTLQVLAHWALQFSPRISLQEPAELVLEIGASLKLFGSLPSLLEQCQQGLAELGYTAWLGIAPTVLGAQVLARGNDQKAVLDLDTLRQRLATCPPQRLQWPDKLLRKLKAIGVHDLQACEQLPRDGFIKRYGAAARQQLDQLWGRTAHPLPGFEPQARFQRSLDLLSETEQLDFLVPGFERLFGELQGQLQGQGCGVLTLRIELTHGLNSSSVFELQLQRPSRQSSHWLELLQHHFERLVLPAPVRAIGVSADHFMALGHAQAGLWQQADTQQQQQLMEHLAARLGPSVLRSLNLQSSHCPEQAWSASEPGQARSQVAAESRPRPLWLVQPPKPVAASQLRQFSATERLETTWWDTPCQRDYYRARHQNGQHVWVFRPHQQPEKWFIHGIFG